MEKRIVLGHKAVRGKARSCPTQILNHQVTTARTLAFGMDRGDELRRDVSRKGGRAFSPSVFPLLRHPQILQTFLCGAGTVFSSV